MNSYIDLKLRHQKEMNEFPLHFAFGNEQLERKMAELGLTESNIREKIVIIPGTGGFLLKKDEPRFLEMCERHCKERKAAIARDADGSGYIFEMFRYELSNHEYGYTLSDTHTLEALGYTQLDVENNVALKNGLERAKKSILAEEK